jgi:hypothetical protein
MLIVAWTVGWLSLWAPGIDAVIPVPPLLVLGYTPLALIVIGVVAVGFSAPLSWAAPSALAICLFLLTPVVLIGRVGRGRAIRHRIMAIGLLGVWAFPIGVEVFNAPQKSQWHFNHLGWGYYIMAGAFSLAFLAIELGPPTPPRQERRRGFAVITEATGRPHISKDGTSSKC